MIVVMGIDPGLANTGFGVVRAAGTSITAVDGGVIDAPSGAPQEQRLSVIHDALEELIDWHEPAALALEELYFGKNVRSALAVGQARGVVLLAAAQKGIPCFDYTPQAVKMSVCGTGGASKRQVQEMVATLLSLPGVPQSEHAADALAAAICHASHARSSDASAAAERHGVGVG
jgi:crossover junction endodeoxyribonuclease RuvC